MSSKDENENENGNDKTLMSSNKDDDNENDNENENEDDDDETMSQNEKNIRIKNINDYLDEIIDKSKSFEDQIKSIRKVENLNEYQFTEDYGDKELKFKIFNLKLAHLSNIIDKEIFKQTFGHTFETLANKLINTTKKKKIKYLSTTSTKIKKNLKKMKQVLLMII